MDHLGSNSDGRYCVVDEADIRQAVVLYCWAYEARYGNLQMALEWADAALARWRARGLPFRQQDGRRYYDFCAVINFIRWTAEEHGDPTYDEGPVHNWRRTLCAQVPSDWLSDFRATAPHPRRFVVTYRREFNLYPTQPGTFVRLRVPLPLPEGTQRDIVLEHVATGSLGACVTTLPGRLEVRLPALERLMKEFVEVRVAFTTSLQSCAVDPARLEDWDRNSPEYQLYTRPDEGLIRVTAAVARLATALAGHSPDPWQAVQAFWEFFFARLKAGHLHHDALDADDPLATLVRRGWFDCYTGSALFAALCRSRGIPARQVGGVLLHLFPAYHYWAEVLLPPFGWLPVDLGSWILAAGRIDDLPWSQLFLGRLDYRMRAECLPRAVVGMPGVRLPPAWYMVHSFAGPRTVTTFYDLATGEWLYRDLIGVDLPFTPDENVS